MAECLDRARRWHLGLHRLGTLRTRSTSAVWVLWDGERKPTRYSQGDARYWVDTDMWRIAGPDSVGSPLGKQLTKVRESESINHRAAIDAADEPTEERVMHPAESKTFGAKQVATRIGTDAKTFRKFLRSSNSPVQAVGQGKRYDFPESELPRLAKAFKSWQENSKSNGASKKAEARGRQDEEQAVEELDGPGEVLEVPDDPSEDDLTGIELELDDEEGVDLDDAPED